MAADGTIEGIRVASAASFAIGVQWHPEWRYAEDPASLAVFRAFGAACQAFSDAQGRAGLIESGHVSYSFQTI